MGKGKFDPPSKSAFNPVKKSAFDPVKKSAFDPVKKSRWGSRTEPAPELVIPCSNCNCQIRSSFDEPLCQECVNKLKYEIQLLREELDNWVCPHCGYPEVDEHPEGEE